MMCASVAEEHQSWAFTRHDPPAAVPRSRDLLFLHGMAAGSWVWTPQWIEMFTSQGYRCWTMTLPGRAGGGTIGSDPQALDRALAEVFRSGDQGSPLKALARALPGAALFDGPGLDDYSDALAAALKAIGHPCIVISHSLGGAVAQNMMRRGTQPAGNVLICSTPPYGTWRASMEMAVTNLPLWKALFDFTVFGLAGTDPDVLRDNLFPNGIAEDDYLHLLSRFTDESLAATARTPGFPPFAPRPGRRHDMLVLGAEKDRLVPALDVYLTGLYYGCVPKFISRAGHMPMYEPQSAPVTAGIILDWLADSETVG